MNMYRRPAYFSSRNYVTKPRFQTTGFWYLRSLPRLRTEYQTLCPLALACRQKGLPASA